MRWWVWNYWQNKKCDLDLYEKKFFVCEKRREGETNLTFLCKDLLNNILSVILFPWTDIGKDSLWGSHGWIVKRTLLWKLLRKLLHYLLKITLQGRDQKTKKNYVAVIQFFLQKSYSLFFGKITLHLFSLITTHKCNLELEIDSSCIIRRRRSFSNFWIFWDN